MKAVLYVFILLTRFAVSKEYSLEEIYKNVLQKNLEELDISSLCLNQLHIFLSSLTEQLSEKNMWAWKMIDATSKLQSGLLESNFLNFGAFDECVGIKVNTEKGEILGKYCLGSLKIKSNTGNAVFNKTQMKALNSLFGKSEARKKNPNIQWSICLPGGCVAEEYTKIFKFISNTHLKGILNITFTDYSCQTEDDLHPKLSSGATVAIIIFSVLLGLVVVSTLYDLYLQHIKSKPAHILLIAFSLYTNGRKLFAINSDSPEQLPCLNGLRVISMMWVIIAHQYNSMSGVVSNSKEKLIFFEFMLNWLDSIHSMFILSGTLAVDTFLVLSGLLMTYGFFKARTEGAHFNILLYWLHRYLRLTPAFAAVVLVEATLNVYFGSGPLWHIVKHDIPVICQEYWWSALLYIQNYVNPDNMCIGQSWYLSVDMQLYILSPLVLFPLWKWKRIGLTWLCFLILVSIATPFVIAWDYNIASVLNFVLDNPHFENKYYYTTHTRATPWLIGIFIGYFIFKIKKRTKSIKLNSILVLIMWAVCLSVLITCVIGGHSTLRGPDYDKWAHVSYVTFVRPAWAIALAWLIFACIIGYGGPINWFLSFPLYQVLGRLTYSIYLLHGFVILLKIFNTRIPLYISDFEMIYLFWGVTMLSATLSVVWVLVFELPIINIEKVLFHSKKSQDFKLSK